MSQWDTLWINVSLATMDPARTTAYGTTAANIDASDAIAVKDGLIAWLGAMEDLPTDYESQAVADGEGRWVTPGLIDCHTHLVYGGNRAEEFELRLTGVAYDEIARRGGGILSTVRDTRVASEEELYDSAALRLQNFLHEGVTGVEIKSGYGLNRETELKMLRVARRLGEQFPVSVSTTFLGAHTLPPEYAASSDSSSDSPARRATNILTTCAGSCCRKSPGINWPTQWIFFAKASALISRKPRNYLLPHRH
jgi:imidazolonepropionase